MADAASSNELLRQREYEHFFADRGLGGTIIRLALSAAGQWVINTPLMRLPEELRLRPDQHWLDIGCGRAALLRAIGQRVGFNAPPIGLDFSRPAPAPAQQAEAFRWQLDLARARELPVVIHARDADEECFAILDEWTRRVGRYLGAGREIGMMHCARDLLPLRIVGERDRPRHRDHEPDIDVPLGEFEVAREAVHHPNRTS